MIILNIYGGIGNQLFQYSFARLLSEVCHHEVYVNKAGLKLRNDYHGDYLFDLIDKSEVKEINSVFLALLFKAFVKLCKMIGAYQKDEDGDELFNKLITKGLFFSQKRIPQIENINSIDCQKKVLMVDGYYQWPSAMGGQLQSLAKKLRFSSEIQSEFKHMYNMHRGKMVCLHIRRGDYLQFPQLQVCDENYFSKSIVYIKEQVSEAFFIVFSDDIEWVRTNYHLNADVYYFHGNSALDDFLCMTGCDHFIISNSTFSWWAQMLSDKENRIVVSPSKWYQDGRTTDLILENFHIIEC